MKIQDKEHAKFLRKMFIKKLKIPKVYSDDNGGNSLLVFYYKF